LTSARSELEVDGLPLITRLERELSHDLEGIELSGQLRAG
jgi:hypothetical protein